MSRFLKALVESEQGRNEVQSPGQLHFLQKQLRSGTYLSPAQGKEYLLSCCCLIDAVVPWDSEGHYLLVFWAYTHAPFGLLPGDLAVSLSV